ncbi:hypothetical protein FG078_06450 [Vibrio cholerae]|nr:hypothetical protein [Vibrio cholerae]EGR0508053.1 hypothetical protein [Vibrio cholerae]
MDKMEKVSILFHIKTLQGISRIGIKSTARYLEMEFDNDATAISEIEKLKKADADNKLNVKDTISSDKGIIKLSLSKSADFGIYDNFQVLFNKYFKICVDGKLEDDHRDYLLLKNDSPCDNDKEVFEIFENISGWVKLFRTVILSNHYAENLAEIKFYIIEEIDKDKQVKTHELILSNALVFHNFKSIKKMPIDFLFGNDEKYLIEKKLVLKSTILKFFKNDGEAALLKIMQKPVDFEQKFMGYYEFYTHKYSLDRVTREVEKAKLDHFDKINNIIHDNQAKALVIPLVMLGTSFVKTWDLKSSILVLISMSVAAVILITNLNHKKKAINDCKDSAFRILGIFEDEDSNYGNTEKIFDNARLSVSKKAEDAEKLLNRIECFLAIAIIFWALLIFFYK